MGKAEKMLVVRRAVSIHDDYYKSAAYLTHDGKWGPLDLARLWPLDMRNGAEDAAAAAIIADPGRCFGHVKVAEILHEAAGIIEREL